MLLNTEIKGILNRVLRPILFIIGLYFFFTLFHRSWDEVREVYRTANVRLLAYALLSAVVYSVSCSILFSKLLKKYGLSVRYLLSGRVFFYSQIAKYIPGRIWSVIYQASSFKKPGSNRAILYANLDLTVIIILQSIIISLIMIIIESNWILAILLVVLNTTIYVYISTNNVVIYLFGLVVRKFKQKLTKSAATDGEDIVIYIVLSIINIGFYILANYCLLNSLFVMTINQTFLYTAYSTIAWVVGLVSIIFPAGIGVREATFVFLSNYTGSSAAIGADSVMAIAVVYRFFNTLVEILGLGLGYVLGFVYAKSGEKGKMPGNSHQTEG